MNTLVIPFPSSSEKEIVLDMEDIVIAQQSSNTSSTVFISGGSVVLTHSLAPNGAVVNAINQTILNSNSGSASVVMPTGVSITDASYN
jgi:hypothetical protein